MKFLGIDIGNLRSIKIINIQVANHVDNRQIIIGDRKNKTMSRETFKLLKNN